MGYGWSVSIPYIERLNKLGSQELYDANAPYYSSSIDGELGAVSTSSSLVYRARVDTGAFDQYSYSTSTDAWTMYDKNGTRYLFGSSDATRISTTSPTRIYRWMLEEIRDTNDNYITYTYTKDSGQIYPSEIVYTGHSSSDGVMTIDFSTSTRPDAYTSYKTGFKITTNKYLTQIKASINGTRVRQYDLAYTSGNNGYRSLLSSIQETGQDDSGGTITLPAMTFSYVSTTTQFYAPSSGLEPVISTSHVVADTDGNGINDVNLFTYITSTGQTGSHVLINQLTSPSITPPEYWALEGASTTPVERGTRYLDINGDGKADVVRGWQDAVGTTTTYQIWLNAYASPTYSWSGAPGTTSIPAFAYQNASTTMTTGIFGDVNGDGLPDYVMALPGYTGTTTYTGNGAAWGATTTAFVAPQSMPTTVATGTNSMLIDINGDGLADWLYSDGSKTYVLLNTGSGWESAPDSEWTIGTTTLYKAAATTFYDRGIRFFDLNGDGLPDMVHAYTAATTAGSAPLPEQATYKQVFLNTGHGWATSTAYTLPAYITTGTTTPWNGVLTYNEYGNWSGNGQHYQDVLSTIHYAKGGSTDITYQPTATQGTNPQLPISLLTVTKIINHDGQGSNEETDYTYSGGKLYLPTNVFDRKFAGFYTITETRPDSIITTYYHQGDTASSTDGEQNDGYAQIGHPFRQDIADPSNNVVQRTYYRWDADAPAAATTTFPTSGLAAYWKFDESSAAAGDSTANGNTLTNNNTATFTTGKINNGTSLVRANNQYFTKSDDASLSITGSLTLAGWVKFNSLPTTGQLYRFLGKTDGTASGESYFLTAINSGGTLRLYGQVRKNSTTYSSLLNNWSFSTGTWYHVAMVYDATGRTITLYVNGSQLGSQATSTVTSVQDTGATFYAGAGAVANEQMNGMIDEAGVWSRALSAGEISTLYNSGTGFSYPISTAPYTFLHVGETLTENLAPSAGVRADAASTYAYASSTQNLITIDDYGQVTGNADGTFSDIGSDNRTTSIAYAASTSVNLYLPYEKTVFDASSSTTTDTRFYYDSLPLGSVSLGNQTKEEDWISGTLYASTTKTYNPYGLVTTSTDPLGHATSYLYDSLNFYPATTTNALSQSTGFLYNYANGKPKQSNDPNGRFTQTLYDAVGRVATTSQSDTASPSTLDTKAVYLYTDTTTPSLIHEVDYLTATTTVDTYDYYDGLGRPIQERRSTEDPANSTVTDTLYNTAGLVASSTLPYFSTGTSLTTAASSSALYSAFTYDPLQRQTKVSTVVGSSTTAYGGWAATTTDADGDVKGLYQDAFGNLARVNEVSSTSTYATLYSYDAAGNLTKITDANGNVRNFTYDGLARRLTAEDLHAPSDGTFGTWNYHYDLSGNIASTTDPKSQEIDYTYDALNRPLTEDYTGGAGTEISYTYDSCTDGIGSLCAASTAAAATANTYDILGRLATTTATISGVDYNTAYTYDLQGNPLTITYPDGREVSYGYNSAGLIKSASAKPKGGSYTPVVSSILYAPNSRPSYELFNNGAETSYTYDAAKLYRLTRIFSHVGSTTIPAVSCVPTTNLAAYWKFDESSGAAGDSTANGNTLTNNNTATFTTGKINNGTSLIRANHQYFTRADDASLSVTGSLTLAGWVKFNSLPSTNILYKLFSKSDGTASGESYHFSLYNNAGTLQLYGQVRANSTTYSFIGRTWTPATSTWYHVAFVFDAGAKTGTLYVNGSQLSTSTTGMVGSIQDTNATFYLGDSSIGANENDDGMIDEAGVWSRALSANEIAQIYNAGSGETYGTCTATSTIYTNVVQDLNYTYDNVGNITQVVDNASSTGAGRTVLYTYDALNRLTSASSTAASSSPYIQSYSYNPIGNLTYKSDVGSYTYSATGIQNPHAPTAINGTTYSYDNNGNLTSASPWTYAWDYRNRLLDSTNGTASSTYTYDYLNNRVSQLTSSGITLYPSKYYAIASSTSGGVTPATSTDYIYAGDSLLAQIEQKLSNGANVGNATTTYVHADLLGSVNALTNASGTMVQALDYYPYGSSRIASTTAGIDSKHKYIGQYFDDPSSLSYLNARYYEGSRGQFLSEDPVFLKIGSPDAEKLANRPMQQILSDPQSLNSYSYAEDNPINIKDPSGLMSSNTATILGLHAQVINLLSQIVVKLGGGGSAGNPRPASTAMMAHSTTINPGPLNITPQNQQSYGNVINQIQQSIDFNTYVKKQVKDNSQNGTINVSGNDPNNSLTFGSGDLQTALHRVNAGLSGKQSANGTWNLHVNINDTYNFEPNNYGKSYSSGAISTLNISAVLGQWTQVITPYPVNINFDYTYKHQ